MVVASMSIYNKDKEETALIHHWDTDGICATKLLLDFLSTDRVINKTPTIGNYFLTEKEIADFSEYSIIYILDMALPKENILALAQHSNVTILITISNQK